MRFIICITYKDVNQEKNERKLRREKFIKKLFHYFIKFQPLIIAVFQYLIRINID